MNILNTRKAFQDVKVGEKIYILDPQDQVTVREITVTKSMPHPKSQRFKWVWVIEAYLPFRMNYITDDKLKEAETYGTKVTQQFFVPKDDVMVLLQATTPTIMATEAKYIHEWMIKPKSGLVQNKKNK